MHNKLYMASGGECTDGSHVLGSTPTSYNRRYAKYKIRKT